MGCFKVAQFLILFNVIKAELLGVSPTVTKDGKEREAEGGGEKRREICWGDDEGKCAENRAVRVG